jgi:glycine cleavage system H protein
MDFPDELKYSKEHLWVRLDGHRAVIGISDFAQVEMGVLKAVELPSVGDELEQDDSFGTVEARKTVADLYAPISGTVIEVNDELESNPALMNDDPYDSGWIVVVELADDEELKALMNADDYGEYVSQAD